MVFKQYLNLVLLLLLVSCSTTKKVVEKDNKTAIVKERIVSYKDTVFVTERVVSEIKVPFEKIVKQYDTVFVPQVIKQRHGNATAKLTIKRDTILVTAECDTIKLKAKIKEEYQKDYKHSALVHKQNTTKNRGVTFWQLLIAISIALVTGYLVKAFKLI